jgi:hypothetical protein
MTPSIRRAGWIFGIAYCKDFFVGCISNGANLHMEDADNRTSYNNPVHRFTPVAKSLTVFLLHGSASAKSIEFRTLPSSAAKNSLLTRGCFSPVLSRMYFRICEA